MGSEVFNIFIDILVLVFLGATIFYAYRLSKSLNEFKSHRREFDEVVTNLLSAIDQAERSINNLKQVGTRETEELVRFIDQSKAMSEELKVINEAGESLAKRLEKMAEANRGWSQDVNNAKRPDKKVSSPLRDDTKARKYGTALRKIKKTREDKPLPRAEVDMPSFMINDREFSGVDDLGKHLDTSTSNDRFDDGAMPEELQSDAEKELYAALRGAKGARPRGNNS